MKVIYVENRIQDENTEDPQLIDGEIYYWKTEFRKLRGTFKEEIEMFSQRGDTKYLLISDVYAIDKRFCDQDCKPGEGCKKDYKEDDHAIVLECYQVKHKRDPKEY